MFKSFVHSGFAVESNANIVSRAEDTNVTIIYFDCTGDEKKLTDCALSKFKTTCLILQWLESQQIR